MPETDRPAPSNPLVAALLAGSAPKPLKLSAARGVLPIVRGELVRILVALAQDLDDDIRTEAGARLASFADEEILPLLSDPACDPAVLRHFAADPDAAPERLEAVLANSSTALETLEDLARRIDAARLDLLLVNQTRLIQFPQLIDRIEANPAITPLQRARVQEFRLHFLARPLVQEPEASIPVGSDASTLSTGPSEPLPRAPEPEAHPAGIDEMREAASVVADNVMQKIMRMNAAEKIQLAAKGSREERAILIKDSSKSVQEAVLTSPKLTENEVEAFAKMRSLTEDVMRIISGNRDWMKSYAITHALATNPKTPTGVALNLVARLTSRDLKIVAGDRNVAEIVRRQARKVIEARNQRPGHRH